MLPRLVIKFHLESDRSLITPRANYCNFEIKLTLVYLIFKIGAGLESVYTSNRIVGSNPSLRHFKEKFDTNIYFLDYNRI